jgi:hypothetical protein
MGDTRNSETTSSIEQDRDTKALAKPETVLLPQSSSFGKPTRNRTKSVDEHNFHQGIYWRSPITMVSLFLFGVVMCLGHHLYYNSLIGKLVGDVDDQQRALRCVSIYRASFF